MADSHDIKVSVVVTTYNQEDTIVRTLESILSQKCRFRFEIQLSDDCSTDATPNICQRYAEKYPDIVRFNRNATNRGCRDNYFDTLIRCNAPYIADCAGDDYWIDPEKLQKQAEILDSDPEITLVHTNWEYQDSATGVISPSPHNSRPLPTALTLFQPTEIFLPTICHKEHPFIHLCSAMYRKTIFDKAYAEDEYLFRSSDFPCEDLQLKVLYAHEGKIAYIPDVTLRYSIGHTSVSSTENHTKTFDFYLGSLKLTAYLAKKYQVAPGCLAQTYAKLASYLFAEAYFAHDEERIRSLLTFLADHHIPLPSKSRLLLPTLHIPLLWRYCAHIKACIAHLRQLL